ncbi:MAG: hypothetical protein GF411_08165 [Candidatus Lokiarchaeota archaeon]|nr:hypothetical protein [Candidatus Lokiarchaeota archaeon]
MEHHTFIKLIAAETKTWRDMELTLMEKEGWIDLSYRPRNNMSSLGWVLAHQAMVLDYTLNTLILGDKPVNPEIFSKYRPGTDGSWDGISLKDILELYDSLETNFLEWAKSATVQDFSRVVSGDSIPSFFCGKTVLEIILSTFTHLDYHTGHLSAIRKDWLSTRTS